MSALQIYTDSPKPWCNCRVNDLAIDGEVTYRGSAVKLGSVGGVMNAFLSTATVDETVCAVVDQFYPIVNTDMSKVTRALSEFAPADSVAGLIYEGAESRLVDVHFGATVRLTGISGAPVRLALFINDDPVDSTTRPRPFVSNAAGERTYLVNAALRVPVAQFDLLALRISTTLPATAIEVFDLNLQVSG